MKKDQSEKSAIDNLLISYPCPIKWDNINPEEKEWLCSQCDKKVVNLSTFSQLETEQFLANNVESGESCVRVRIGTDGKVISDNCPAFLKPVRNHYRRLEKVVVAGLLSVVTFIGSAWDFCVYAADPKSGAKGNDPISKSIKSTQSCLKYKLEGDEGYVVDGRPAPNEIRDALNFLLYLKSDDKLLDEFKTDVGSTRVIDLKKLDNLGEHLNRVGIYLGYFQSKLLLYLIYTKSPTGENPPVGLEDLAAIRDRTIKSYLDKAEAYLKKGKDAEARNEVRQIRIAAWQSHQLADNIVLPEGVKIWNVGGRSGPSHFEFSNWVISRKDLDRFLKLDMKLNGKTFSLPDGSSIVSIEELESKIQSNEIKKKGNQ